MQFCLREKIFAMVGSNLNEFGLFFNHGTIVGHGSPKEAPPPQPLPLSMLLCFPSLIINGGGGLSAHPFFPGFLGFLGFFALFQLGWE